MVSNIMVVELALMVTMMEVAAKMVMMMTVTSTVMTVYFVIK